MANPLSSEGLFHLKPFSLSHHRASMRAGTDAILLGLFATVPNHGKTLEIGTGSGIISLLIASRFNTYIDAIDVDKASVAEARSNFSRSPFYHRLMASEADFNQYAKTCSTKYDLIISNPPFFINDLRPDNEVKRAARHGDLLSFTQICEGAVSGLQHAGTLCLVLPYDESRVFIQTATEKGLHVQKQQVIFPKRGLQPNRINLQLGFKKPKQTAREHFILREEDGSFTPQYIQYLKDYYIGLK